jgi:hypothetical protein
MQCRRRWRWDARGRVCRRSKHAGLTAPHNKVSI